MEYKEHVKQYFESNAEAWMIDAYEEGGYNYPTPQHRLRVVSTILNEREKVKNVLDLGCGGGAVATGLARQGFNVVGVDQSDTMLSYANEQLASQKDSIKGEVVFKKSSIEDFNQKGFDAVVTMGVIGYMPDDDHLFKIVSNILDEGGYYIVSFRNRLFNLFSISDRTVAEANNGSLPELVRQAAELQQQVTPEQARSFVSSLNRVSDQILKEGWQDNQMQAPSEKKGKNYDSVIEARQTTPQDAIDVAQRYGFVVEQLYGIHPHFTVPGFNHLLPPGVYNRLSDSLVPLETNAISLLWSSVFIGVFKKA